LGAGLAESGRISEAASERALACLERFGQRLDEVPAECVRALGTNTLREAENARAFLVRAARALGHRIEVISGQEEARLIYRGVNRSVAGLPPRRLVVDIGGGSTECIVGEDNDIDFAESLHMGCVSYSQRFFPNGKLGEKR